jgi:hypothetical protein
MMALDQRKRRGKEEGDTNSGGKCKMSVARGEAMARVATNLVENTEFSLP